MVSKEAKKAFESAENDLKKEEGEQLKEVIKATLEKLKEKQGERAGLDKEIKLLKRDIDDFKAGRLDRIAERQEKDDLAREVSVFKIVKKEVNEVHHHHHHHDRWYWPYQITWKDEWYPRRTEWTTVTDGPSIGYLTSSNGSTGLGMSNAFAVNCSVAKDFTSGAYNISNGDVVHL